MNIINSNLSKVKFNKLSALHNANSIVYNKEQSESASFQNILDIEEAKTINFSKHAFNRLWDRDLSLSVSQIKRIESGIEKAEKKGINDSLVLVDNIALVVNIKNRTVVTAMPSNNEKIYTNIDGAVIV